MNTESHTDTQIFFCHVYMDPTSLVDVANQMRYLKHDKLRTVKPMPSVQVDAVGVSSSQIGEFVDNPFLAPLPKVVYDARGPCEIFGEPTRMHLRK